MDPVKVQMPLSDDLCFFAQLPTFYQPTGSLLSEWPVGMTKKVIRSVMMCLLSVCGAAVCTLHCLVWKICCIGQLQVGFRMWRFSLLS